MWRNYFWIVLGKRLQFNIVKILMGHLLVLIDGHVSINEKKTDLSNRKKTANPSDSAYF